MPAHYSPILIFHIVTGTLGMLSGFVAIFFRKGTRRHAIAGQVFVISMLGLASSGFYMAVLKFQPGNMLGGALTFYMVTTAWRAGRVKEVKPFVFDWIALLLISAVAGTNLLFGFEALFSSTGMKFDYPPWPYFFIGSVASLALIGDIRLLFRGSITGKPRIARHLWRMSFALFIAASSIFLARQRFFPAILQKSGALYFLSFLPVALMIFWLFRVRRTSKIFPFAKNARTHDSVFVSGSKPDPLPAPPH